jgi:hypothetical protein
MLLDPVTRESGPVTRIKDWVSFADEGEEGTEDQGYPLMAGCSPPAMVAARRDQGGGAREGGGCGAQADAEKEVQGSSSGFIEREREGKAAAEAEVAKDGHGSGGFNSNSRGALKGG